MFADLFRKLNQLLSDAVLRRWTLGRLAGKYAGEPAFSAHCPPYLTNTGSPADAPYLSMERGIQISQDDDQHDQFDVQLPGERVSLQRGRESNLFLKSYRDIETELAAHRFAWVPLQWGHLNGSWVDRIWRAWCDGYGDNRSGWPWHPYTAAERAINIIHFANHFGLPGSKQTTEELLIGHLHAIAENLEYFGGHHTSNHLSNNGRGLYFLGLHLNSDESSAMGRDILVNEADRIFDRSGVLREGSSHYHFLLTRNYVSAWLLATKFGRPEKDQFKAIAERSMAVLPSLTLLGGLPLIGDISPDCPPSYLMCLFEGSEGWIETLDENEKQLFLAMRDSVAPEAKADLDNDGWFRADLGNWSGLWHVAKEGWSHMPGHGHQDCGSFELHYAGVPIFVDPGRGSYGEAGEAADYRSARRHNAILVDQADPFPPNKPYYDSNFRRKICGDSPQMDRLDNGLRLRHHGFGRLRGVGALERLWQFDGDQLTIDDQLSGRGKRIVDRYLYTSLDVERDDGSIILSGDDIRLSLTSTSGKISVEEATRWRAYGNGESMHMIRIEDETKLPWRSQLRVAIQP